MFALITYNLLDEADLTFPTGGSLDIHLPMNTEVFALNSPVFYMEPPASCMIYATGNVDRVYTATDQMIAIVTRDAHSKMTHCSAFMKLHDVRMLNLWAIDNEQAMFQAFESLH